MMTSTQDNDVQTLLDRLGKQLKPLERIAIALSGGVDSAVLVSAAARILGPDHVLAVTVSAPMVPASDHADAIEAARIAGVRHIIIAADADLLQSPVFKDNPPDRCYHCKQLIFSKIMAAAREHGFPIVCDGTNADDLGQYRPGLQALREMGVRSPLADAGLTKAQIRELASAICSPFADKPAMACLATRIPHGVSITVEALERIDRAEALLRSEGLGQLRVRDHLGLARVELPATLLEQGISAWQIRRLREILHESGFEYATLDLDGYRTGSMEVRSKGD